MNTFEVFVAEPRHPARNDYRRNIQKFDHVFEHSAYAVGGFVYVFASGGIGSIQPHYVVGMYFLAVRQFVLYGAHTRKLVKHVDAPVELSAHNSYLARKTLRTCIKFSAEDQCAADALVHVHEHAVFHVSERAAAHFRIACEIYIVCHLYGHTELTRKQIDHIILFAEKIFIELRRQYEIARYLVDPAGHGKVYAEKRHARILGFCDKIFERENKLVNGRHVVPFDPRFHRIGYARFHVAERHCRAVVGKSYDRHAPEVFVYGIVNGFSAERLRRVIVRARHFADVSVAFEIGDYGRQRGVAEPQLARQHGRRTVGAAQFAHDHSVVYQSCVALIFSRKTHYSPTSFE